MLRLVLTVTLALPFLVKPADMQSQEEVVEGEEGEEVYYYDEELSEFDFVRENVFNLTEQERFCLNISEQLNATKHRGFLHGFCIKTLLCFSEVVRHNTFSGICDSNPRVGDWR